MGHIAIVDCAIQTLAIPCFNRLVQKFDSSFTYHLPPQDGTSSLQRDQNAKAYIIFGSHSNVEDRLSWQRELALWMKEKIMAGIPVIGICFGHQLMADAFGGKIEKHPGGKSLQGIREVEIRRDYKSFRMGEKLSIAIAHSYQVTQRPQDFLVLGSSQNCPNDILMHKSLPYIGLQGHPEASQAFFDNEITETKLNAKEIASAQAGGDSFLKKALTAWQSLS